MQYRWTLVIALLLAATAAEAVPITACGQLVPAGATAGPSPRPG